MLWLRLSRRRVAAALGGAASPSPSCRFAAQVIPLLISIRLIPRFGSALDHGIPLRSAPLASPLLISIRLILDSAPMVDFDSGSQSKLLIGDREERLMGSTPMVLLEEMHLIRPAIEEVVCGCSGQLSRRWIVIDGCVCVEEVIEAGKCDWDLPDQVREEGRCRCASIRILDKPSQLGYLSNIVVVLFLALCNCCEDDEWFTLCRCEDDEWCRSESWGGWRHGRGVLEYSSMPGEWKTCNPTTFLYRFGNVKWGLVG